MPESLAACQARAHEGLTCTTAPNADGRISRGQALVWPREDGILYRISRSQGEVKAACTKASQDASKETCMWASEPNSSPALWKAKEEPGWELKAGSTPYPSPGMFNRPTEKAAGGGVTQKPARKDREGANHHHLRERLGMLRKGWHYLDLCKQVPGKGQRGLLGRALML